MVQSCVKYFGFLSKSSGRFGDESIEARGTCCSRNMWPPNSSAFRVLAWSVRGPVFESKSAHVLFPPLWHLVVQCGSVFGLRTSNGLSRWFPAKFRAASGTNLFKKGEIVAVRPCDPLAQ